jgi:molybdopterin molybdotransferase
MAKPPRLSVSEGLALIRAVAPDPGTETIGIDAAFARIAARPVDAKLDVPRFACSAMDGFALLSSDTARASIDLPVVLPLGPALQAGGIPDALATGTATPISTGAPIPPGADAVLMQERAQIETAPAPQLTVASPVVAGTNVRQRGEDVRAGYRLVNGGDRLDAETIGLLSAAGISEVVVRRRPRIAYFSTGDELTDGGLPLASSSAIFDANRPMIAALAAEAGLPFRTFIHSGDTHDSVDALIRTAAEDADIVISSGGVSGGAFDLVRGCVERQGGEIVFHGVEMRPGKPILFARFADGTLYFGLPGNPVAALVGLRFFVLEAVRAMLGLDPEEGEAVADPDGAGTGSTRFLRVTARRTPAGDMVIDPDLDQRSHILSSAARASGWLRTEAGQPTATLYPKRPGRLT